MNLEQRVIKAKAGDKESMEEIINMFNPLVIKMATSTFIVGFDFDDLKQIGYLSIIKAVKMVDMNKGGNYTAYIYQAVKRNFYYEIRRKVKDQYVTSINIPCEDGGGELGDSIGLDFDLEEDYVKKDELKRLIKIIGSLVGEEKELMEYLLKYQKGGITRYSQDKSVNYTTCIKKRNRIFAKIKKQLEDGTT
jgi:RNA polymerase sporulation-specific sigma factor